MRIATQIAAVTLLNLRTLPERIGNSLVVVIGIAGVVGVLLAALAVASGFRQTIANTGRTDRAIVLTRGAPSESASTVSRESLISIASAPGVAMNAAGKPLVSAELLAMALLTKQADGSDAFVTIRGVGAEAFGIRREIRLEEGRMFQAGLRELIVGRSAQRQFAGLNLGDRVRLSDGDWTVVGVFSSGADSRESELFADSGALLSAYRRNAFNSVTVQLSSERSFLPFKDSLLQNPQLVVDVWREDEYFSSLSQPLNRILKLVAYGIGFIMTIGATFGALNTMHFAVRARSVEIATLRAIGFSGVAIVVSILVEAVLLAQLGALIGVTIVYVGFDGRTISTIGDTVGNNPQLVYSLVIEPALVVLGIALAAAIGLVGGLLPGMRAARLPVAAALREN
ncbi:ABC transporter permease [Steroidobacter agaridevorans]|uniref:ABC transporter permease n=1 Tax=Steroidobacter agaridevorans TaxID=2695856 RepID=UPI001327B858|nr:ABC transporter permease [Steroidobacter agaridevorans]GFE90764.1 membrane protein [Steroidobacter agaridevorans]